MACAAELPAAAGAGIPADCLGILTTPRFIFSGLLSALKASVMPRMGSCKREVRLWQASQTRGLFQQR